VSEQVEPMNEQLYQEIAASMARAISAGKISMEEAAANVHSTLYHIGQSAPIGFFDTQGGYHQVESQPCYEEMLVPYPEQEEMQ